MFHIHADRGNWIPFTLAEGQRQKPMKLDIQSIIQALITAAVTAAIVMYASVRVLDERVETIQRDLQRVEASVNKINNDFYQPSNGRH